METLLEKKVSLKTAILSLLKQEGCWVHAAQIEKFSQSYVGPRGKTYMAGTGTRRVRELAEKKFDKDGQELPRSVESRPYKGSVEYRYVAPQIVSERLVAPNRGVLRTYHESLSTNQTLF